MEEMIDVANNRTKKLFVLKLSSAKTSALRIFLLDAMTVKKLYLFVLYPDQK